MNGEAESGIVELLTQITRCPAASLFAVSNDHDDTWLVAVIKGLQPLVLPRRSTAFCRRAPSDQPPS